ncbi:hypothetical protein D3C78_1670220 [compost metagenome]
MGEPPPHGDERDILGAAIFEDFLTHGSEAILLQVGHRRQSEMLFEALEQLEARNPGRLLDTFKAEIFASMTVDKIPSPQQVVRELNL